MKQIHAVWMTRLALCTTAMGFLAIGCAEEAMVNPPPGRIAVDLEQNKLDLALKLGADHALLADQVNVADEVQKLTAGRGAHIAVEVVGNTTAINTAISSLRKGGALTIVGNLAATVEFPLQEVVTRQISVAGSCSSCGEYPACLDMIANNKINVDVLLSKVAPLAEGAMWFENLYNGEEGLMKVILKP